MNFNTLNDLALGKKAVIKKLENTGSIRRRLLDIGLIEGTEIESTLRSPSGDPTAYFIRGALIAIRDTDAKNIQIEVI